MVQEWLANGVFLYLMAGVCGAAVLLKLLLNGYYRRQLRQASNMNKAKKRWLQKMRQEYADCMDMHGRVNNVDIFVDKYVEGKKFMGIMLSTWDKIGGQAWILCAGLLVMAAVSGIFYQVDREAILFTFFIGIWTVIVDIVVDNIANLVEKRNQLKRSLKDYFDNHAWDGVELQAKEEEEEFPQEEAFWEEGDFSQGEEFDENVAFSREAAMEEEGDAEGEGASGQDTYPGTIRIRHLVKPEGEAWQGTNSKKAEEESPDQGGFAKGSQKTGTNVDFEEWKRKTGTEKHPQAEGNSPKFYVVSKPEQDKVPYQAEYAKNEEAAEERAQGEGKRTRKESKKEMAARKKREHMKYELKREITQKAEEKETAQEPSEKKNASREAVEQLAAAIDVLKKENALEEAAPLLAAQISRDQENGALIEEVLREFLV